MTGLQVSFFLFKIISGSLQAITSSGTKKGDLFLADVATQLKNKNVTTDVKVDTNSNVSIYRLFLPVRSLIF